MTHSGLCGTDLHSFEWGQVLGHEGVGTIQDIGQKVPSGLFTRGETVAWGIQFSVRFMLRLMQACGFCPLCLEGQDIYCPKREIQSVQLLNRGTFATHCLVSHRFVFRIPAGIRDIHAAPLMGAGATVFSALHNFEINPSDRIAVVGLGGVGHLAIQFARAWGCDVTVLSTAPGKRDDAFELGACEFIVTSQGWTDAIQGSIDALLMVANIKPDQWDDYISILKPRAKIILVTAGSGTLGIPVRS